MADKRRIHVAPGQEAAAYSSGRHLIKSVDPDEIGRYRGARAEVEKRKRRDSLYLVLSSALDLADSALLIFLLIFVWNMDYWGILLAGVILSIFFVGAKVAFAVLVYKKMQGFWSKPWAAFLADIVSAFIPGIFIPLFVMAAASKYVLEESTVDCNRGDLDWAIGIISFAKVVVSGVYAGLPWLTDLMTGRGCICVCDLFDCSDCSLERCCEYFLRSVLDKLVIALRALCALLVLIFGLIEDHNIGDICYPSAAGISTASASAIFNTTTIAPILSTT